jgi:hypothetical protein
MAIIPRLQIKADDDVIAYFLKKQRWSRDEFATLFCGINPFAWERKEVFTYGDDAVKIPKDKKEYIENVLTLIEDRLETHISISNTPYQWRNLMPNLELTAPAWMSQIVEPDSIQENKTRTLPGVTPASGKEAGITGPTFARLQKAIQAFDPKNPPRSKKVFMGVLENLGCDTREQEIFANIAAEQFGHNWRS